MFKVYCILTLTYLYYNVYYPSLFRASSTFQRQDKDFSVGEYFKLNGRLGSESLELNGNSIGVHEFGLSNETSEFFQKEVKNIDGLIGLKPTFDEGYKSGINRILQFENKKLFTIHQIQSTHEDILNGVYTVGGYDDKNCNLQYKPTFPFSSGSISPYTILTEKIVTGKFFLVF